MKKLFFIYISIVLALPIIAQDFTYTFEGQTLTYSILDEKAHTCQTKAGDYMNAGNRVSGIVTIPSIAKFRDIEYNVVGIGACGFVNCVDLDSIVIPRGMNSIGEGSFISCVKLKGINLHDSIKFIGSSAFLDCKSLMTITIPPSISGICDYTFSHCTKLVEVSIPSSITSIGTNAFSFCESIKDLVLPTSVEIIGNGSFEGCISLNNFSIPTSISSISDECFSGCSNLRNIYIPNSVTTIGNSAFSSCANLAEINIPNSVTTIGNNAFYRCEGLTHFTIPNSITSISSGMFSNCNNLTEITIPNFITSIGKYAFSECINLNKVTLPNSISEISENTFSNCGKLSELSIPNSIISIGKNAFSYCIGLQEITIPSSVTKIESGAFSYCSGLKKATFTSFDSYYNIDFENADANPLNCAKHLFIGEEEVTEIIVPDGITTLNGTFAGCTSLTSIILPKTLTEIGNDTFYNCSGLSEIIIPNSVTKIGAGAFCGCKGLTEFIIPNSVTEIEIAAFSNCRGLTEIKIPGSVKKIGKGAFAGCVGLNRAIFPSFEALYSINFDGQNSNPLFNAHHLYIGEEEVTDIVVPNYVTKLNCTFAGGKYLKSIFLPNSISEIGSAVFIDCCGLQEISLPNSVVSIGSQAFRGCSGLSNFIIPSSVNIIGHSAFKGCSAISEITIPYSVKSIGDGAFSGCQNLLQLKFLSPNPPYIAGYFTYDTNDNLRLSIPVEGVTAYLGTEAFANFNYVNGSNVKYYSDTSYDYKFLDNPDFRDAVVLIKPSSIYDNTIDIPEGFYEYTDKGDSIYHPITAVGASRTFYPYDLQKVNFTSYSKIRAICQGTFSSCRELNEIILPNSLTYIGPSAFDFCDYLTQVTMPNSVTSIGRSAFANCPQLRNISLSGSLREIGNSVFSFTGLKEVILPPGIETIHSSAFSYCQNLKRIALGHKVKYIDEWAFYKAEADNIFITAQKPPIIYENTFSTLDATLFLQASGDASIVEAYRNASIYWNKFDMQLMNNPTKIECNLQTIEGNTGDTFQIDAKVLPENVTLPYLFWHSTNPEVAIVDNNGVVTIMGEETLNTSHSEQSKQTCSIIAETLYADGPQLEVIVYNMSATIENIIDDRAPEGKINYTLPFNVYNLHGRMMGNSIEKLYPGIYIVRQNRLAQKIVIK